MNNDKKLLIKDYLSNINVGVSDIGYQKVWPEWRDIDYIPSYNKFYLICEGEGYLRINDVEYYPKPGQLFLMPKGIKQSYSTISDNTFIKYWCHFTANVGDVNLFDVISIPYFIDVKDWSIPESLFKEMVKNSDSAEFTSALRIKAALLGLISYYMDNIVMDKINLSATDRMEKLKIIINYIDNNLSESITIEKLAKIVHLHPNYFIRLFKKTLGTSPINYIINKRIDKAKNMIKTTDATLSTIGDKIGISDVYYLSKLFKEHTGFAPTEYRKISRKNLT